MKSYYLLVAFILIVLVGVPFLFVYWYGIPFGINALFEGGEVYFHDVPFDVDLSYYYDFYIAGKPDITERLCFGNGSITVVAYLDFNSTPSKRFVTDYLPLVEHYVERGTVTYCHKSYITKKDKNFIYAHLLYCLKDTLSMESYKQMFGFGLPDVLEEVEKCERSLGVIQDMSESLFFGSQGVGPKIYVGIKNGQRTLMEGLPSYSRFNSTLRDYHTRIGELP